jgi:hypothetical protein
MIGHDAVGPYQEQNVGLLFGGSLLGEAPLYLGAEVGHPSRRSSEREAVGMED